MNFDMDPMYSSKVWNLVNAPEDIVPIGCKWILKKNIIVDGNVETYKVRLVDKGYRQRQSVDYDESFTRSNAKIYMNFVGYCSIL